MVNSIKYMPYETFYGYTSNKDYMKVLNHHLLTIRGILGIIKYQLCSLFQTTDRRHV